MCIWGGYAHISTDTTKAREGIRSPGARVADSCKQPSVGAGNHTQALHKQYALLITSPFLQPQLDYGDVFVFLLICKPVCVSVDA